MTKIVPGLVGIIVKYNAPLQRYARLLVKDPAIASALVKEMFELVYDENSFLKTEDELRHLLKDYTLKACHHWLRVQALFKSQNN